MYKAFLVFLSIALLFSCQTKPQKKLKEGTWLLSLDINSGEIPINTLLENKEDSIKLTLINGEEQIILSGRILPNDSIILPFAVFNSVLRLKLVNDTSIEGRWVDFYRGNNYYIPVFMKRLEANVRFQTSTENYGSVQNRYKVVFSPGDEDSTLAIGLFEQNKDKLYGTFATETGDYRHLEGVVAEDSIFLSTFDGAHAYLFKGKIKEDSIFGTYYSGNHYQTNFSGIASSEFELRNPDSLTYLKEKNSSFDFWLRDVNGNMVSINDDVFNQKIVLIQIMGTWCPNCMDESVYYQSLYEKYKSNGLEIVAVAFERARTKEQALLNLEKLQKKLNLSYSLLLGGSTRKDKAEEVFPMLNHIMSYPTTIVLDKSKRVYKIHTGFYGPSTGSFYEDYTQNMESMLDSLLGLRN